MLSMVGGGLESHGAAGVDVLVLGAFGCGAFRNNPVVVAEAYAQLLVKYKGRFSAVEFAVYSPPHSSENYDAFSKRLA